MLLLFALLKILLLALSFKSGYLGGPTFPTLFSCTMVAMALSLIFPAIPVSILVLCIESAAVALLLNAPLTAILLVAVVGTADPYMIALMCLSTATAMFVGLGVKRLRARRAADKAEQLPLQNKHISRDTPLVPGGPRGPLNSHQPKTSTQDFVGARAAGWMWCGPLWSPVVGRQETWLVDAR